MAVTKRTRYEVMKRDNFTCRYCRSTENPLTIDHVVPVALGGTDDPSNLVAACQDCNYGKGSSAADSNLVDDVTGDQIRWADAMKRAADVRAESRKEVERFISTFDELWADRWSVPWNYEQSLEALYKAGLPLNLLVDSIEITFNARGVYARFNYLCGVAWKKVNELQEIARKLLDEDSEADA